MTGPTAPATQARTSRPRRALRLLHAATLALALTCAWGAPPATAQEPRVFDLLEGFWEGEGTLLGQPAHFAMRWERHEDFAILSFENAFVGTGGERTPVLSSVAIYRTGDASPEAVWLDSRGVRVEIRWERTPSALVAHWRAPDESGRTTYRLDAPGILDVLDEVQAEGGWRVFGSGRLVKTAGMDPPEL
jgi:hypothetical protein